MLQTFFTLILHAVKPDIKIAVDPDVKILAIFGTNIAFISRFDISVNQGNILSGINIEVISGMHQRYRNTHQRFCSIFNAGVISDQQQ